MVTFATASSERTTQSSREGLIGIRVGQKEHPLHRAQMDGQKIRGEEGVCVARDDPNWDEKGGVYVSREREEAYFCGRRRERERERVAAAKLTRQVC